MIAELVSRDGKWWIKFGYKEYGPFLDEDSTDNFVDEINEAIQDAYYDGLETCDCDH